MGVEIAEQLGWELPTHIIYPTGGGTGLIGMWKMFRELKEEVGLDQHHVYILGRTRDWVVVYFYDDEHAEGQHTIVTEVRGALAGKRVVRGREAECRAHYAALENHVAATEGAR